MLRKALVNNLSDVLRSKSDARLFSDYLDHIAKRPFPNVNQEWTMTEGHYGKPERVHSDNKSSFEGRWTLWVMRGQGAAGEPEKRVLTLMNGTKYKRLISLRLKPTSEAFGRPYCEE